MQLAARCRFADLHNRGDRGVERPAEGRSLHHGRQEVEAGQAAAGGVENDRLRAWLLIDALRFGGAVAGHEGQRSDYEGRESAHE